MTGPNVGQRDQRRQFVLHLAPNVFLALDYARLRAGLGLDGEVAAHGLRKQSRQVTGKIGVALAVTRGQAIHLVRAGVDQRIAADQMMVKEVQRFVGGDAGEP